MTLSRVQADIRVNPEALTKYSHCVSEAKDHNEVFLLDRGVMYRCGDDTATSYFNYLRRMRVPEYMASLPTGLFVYRDIDGVGKCWHQIQDAWGVLISIYGCDIYVEY